MPRTSFKLPRCQSRTAFAVAFLHCLLIPVAFAQQAAHATDALWVVSTRGLPSCPPSGAQSDRFGIWQCQEKVGWQATSEPEFFDQINGDDSQTPLPVCIYVHENRVTASEAFSRAVLIRQRLQQAAGPNCRFRLVLISWPSDQIGILPRPDVQIKAQRSEAHAFYLARLMDKIDPSVPVSLFGHSFGPRMITAALHLLGGGQIDGHALCERTHHARRPVQVVLSASALDADWLLPGRHHDRALTQVDQLLVLFNSNDPVLHWYPRMYGRGGPSALGYVGFPTARLPPSDQCKVHQLNVSRIVGKSHSWQNYEGSAAMMSRIAPYLLRQNDPLR